MHQTEQQHVIHLGNEVAHIMDDWNANTKTVQEVLPNCFYFNMAPHVRSRFVSDQPGTGKQLLRFRSTACLQKYENPIGSSTKGVLDGNATSTFDLDRTSKSRAKPEMTLWLMLKAKPCVIATVGSYGKLCVTVVEGSVCVQRYCPSRLYTSSESVSTHDR